MLWYYHPNDRFCRVADMVPVIMLKEDNEMFIPCPNCNELIKKNVGPCPMCKHEVTADYILKYEQEQRRKDDEYTREKMKIFRKRRNIATLLMCIFIAVMFVTMIAIDVTEHEPAAIALVIAEFVIALIISHITKCFNCPYCGKYYKAHATRGVSFQTDCCPHCGVRLR